MCGWDAQAGGIYQLQAEWHGDDGDVCSGADCFRCCKNSKVFFLQICGPYRSCMAAQVDFNDAQRCDVVPGVEQSWLTGVSDCPVGQHL